MTTHHVTLNGQQVGVAADYYRLLTMVRSVEHHDADGNTITTHELAVEGVDAFGTVAAAFVPPVSLKKGDVIQIVIGDK